MKSTHMFRFLRQVEKKFNLSFSSQADLYQWSIREFPAFWAEVFQYSEIRCSTQPTSSFQPGDHFWNGQWFPGCKLNFAENLLREKDHSTAIIAHREGFPRRELTFAQLHQETQRVAAGLRSAGVGVGDRVAAVLPNSVEAVVGMLATTSLGAIWSSCSPDFGVPGIVDRFAQIEPKILFVCDHYFYNGKRIDLKERNQELIDKLPTVSTTIIIDDEKNSYEQFGAAQKYELTFEQLPFSHPAFILYSSGTTGIPKCIVHSAGGTLLQLLKEHLLHSNLSKGDRYFYFTTCGWMMWNYLVTALGAGATIVLYDGSPTYPDQLELFRIADQEKLSIFGTSARYVSVLEKAQAQPNAQFHLSSLRTIQSTGSPLAPSSFDYLQQYVKKDVQVSSVSGGTDIVSCFMLGSPLVPVYRGELQCRGLGMAVEVFDDEGRSLTNTPGELVCTRPFPSMPIAFWNDPQGDKFRTAYFEHFPDVWYHGDWVKLTERGTAVIYGRSDAVLNPGGVRIGTAELYRTLEAIEEIEESLAVGQQWKGDERIVLFVKTRAPLNDELHTKIRNTIRSTLTPRHVPAKIIFAPELPRTMNGKLVELAVKNLLHGRAVKNTDALINPQSLEYFKNLPELQTD